MAGSASTSQWPREHVPDLDRLFFRIHRTFVKPDGSLGTSALQDRDGSMSTDWEKYARPDETRNRGRIPAENGVVSLPVGGVRSMKQVVEHSPTDANRAHTDVIGEKTPEVRLVMRRLAAWVTPLS